MSCSTPCITSASVSRLTTSIRHSSPVKLDDESEQKKKAGVAMPLCFTKKWGRGWGLWLVGVQGSNRCGKLAVW